MSASDVYDEKVWCRHGVDGAGHWANKSDMTWLPLPKGGRLRMCTNCKNAEMDNRAASRNQLREP